MDPVAGGLDPSVQRNPFAERLAPAIARRGLSLARIQKRLQEAGPSVSVAALSYWSSGRSLPTRARSFEVVRNLERILQVEPGWLVEVMPAGEQRADAASVLRRGDLDDLVQRHSLPSTQDWHFHVVSHRIVVDPLGAERSTRTRTMMTAARDGAQRWAVVVEREAGVSLTGRGSPLAPIRRQIEVSPELVAFEFGFDQPLPRGKCVLVEHTVDSGPGGSPGHDSGYGLRRAADYLALEVHFEGDPPERVRRLFRPPGLGEAVVVEERVLVRGHTAQATIVAPAPGLHYLEW
ncbi:MULTISPECIES: hypothetical protein [unclassified Luteococcus]|uniref:hypothetical protein n=1 Tax=unclassified Luteococcus TaxID=2639923 RepID=UPI00313BD6E3